MSAPATHALIARSLDYVHVDVFSEFAYGGNSLTVFVDAPELSAGDMLRITREMRHFESIFLEPGVDTHHVRARVFDLFEELPFAGHPIIGAAGVLHSRLGDIGEQLWHFELSAKPVTVITRTTAHGYVGVVDQGAPEFLGVVLDRGAIAASFGLILDELDLALPLEVVSTGLRYLVVPVTSAGLERAVVQHDLTTQLRACNAQFAVLLDESRLEIRHWNNDGVLEDIATGSAAGCIGAYRARHGGALPNVEFELAQGRFTGRPSRLFVRAEGGRDALTSIKVGGEIALVGRGSIDLRPAPER